MLEDALLDVTDRDDIVLDCFLGSGSMLLAAEATGRVCRAIEIDGRYCDVAIDRWQQMAGREAILEETSETHTEVARRRSTASRPTENADVEKPGKASPKDAVKDAVGYGRPPKQHQFKPGQSGNPKGRPKGAPTLQEIVAKEATKHVKIKQGDKIVSRSEARGARATCVRQGVGGRSCSSPYNLSACS